MAERLIAAFGGLRQGPAGVSGEAAASGMPIRAGAARPPQQKAEEDQNMRRATILLGVVIIALGVGGTAHADAVLATAPVEISDDCQTCRAVNVSGRTVKAVTVEVIQVDTGSVLESKTCSDLAPNAQCFPGAFCLGFRVVYCKVTVKGPKKAIRAALMPTDETHGPIVALPAL